MVKRKVTLTVEAWFDVDPAKIAHGEIREVFLEAIDNAEARGLFTVDGGYRTSMNVTCSVLDVEPK